MNWMGSTRERPQFCSATLCMPGWRNFSAQENFNAPRCTGAAPELGLQTAMRERRPRAALENWWAARLERIAAWIAETEQARRAERGTPAAIALERSASMMISGGFELKGRADRIERAWDGGITLVDYKTGSPPSAKDVESGTAPQLPLEAVMAEAGAFRAEEYTGRGDGTGLSGSFPAGMRPARKSGSSPKSPTSSAP